MLHRYADLFDGNLGAWNAKPVNFESKENAKPYHAHAYSIPKIHEETLKKEIARLIRLGVLEEDRDKEWAAPCFIIPKKDGTVCFITNFRDLNKNIHRKPFSLPLIQDLLLKLEGFMYATSLDLNMGYYHIRLDFTSQNCVRLSYPGENININVYLWYRVIPQAEMNKLLGDLEYVRAYLDDLLVITKKEDWNDHILKLEKVFL